MLRRLGAVVAVLAVLFVFAGTALPNARAAATQLFPDLDVLPPRDLQFDRTDISDDGSGVIHNVLRFSNSVINKGEGRLEMRGTIDPATQSGTAYQRVYDTDGGHVDYNVGTFYYHPVHNHYHYDGWGQYQLWTKADYDKWIASGRTQGQAKLVGTKTTSCVIDEEFVNTYPNTPWPGVYTSSGCQLNSQNQLLEGLSPGYGDTYDYYRFEQWIDLGATATLADGDYVLRSVADPNNQIYESAGKSDPSRESAANNDASTFFSVSGGKLVDSNPPSGSVSINHVDAQTATGSVSVQVLGRDDMSGITTVKLSNDGVTWASYAYAAPGPSTAQNIAWNLTDTRYGGTSATGTKTVYAEFQDGVGKWSDPVSDTITLQPLTGYAGTVAADNPVSYWRLGETSGTNAEDAMGRNSGTYENGPALGAASLLTADTANKAVGFDGVNDDVLVPNSSSLGVSSAFSLEAWIKPVSLPASGSFRSVVTKQESWSIQFNGPNLEFTVIQSGTRRRLQAPAGAVQPGGTYHVVGTYDGTTQRLYVNGSQVASASLSGGATVTTYPVRLASWNGAKEYFAGTLDDVAVYGTALSAARVAAHWTAGGSAPSPTPTPTPTPSPTAPPTAWASAVLADAPTSWWRLDEIEGTAIHDAMARNDGVMWNSPMMGRTSLVPKDTDLSMALNGTSQYFAVPNSASLQLTSSLTLEAWIHPTSLPAAGSFATVVNKQESYALQFHGPQLELTIIQSGVRRRLLAPAGSIVAGSTYYVVGTYDGATERLYINGTQVASSALTGPASVTTNPVRIGSWNGSKEFLAGGVDEVAVYPTALSATRVATHWQAATGTTAAIATSAPSASATAVPSASASSSPKTTTAPGTEPTASAGPTPSQAPSSSPAPTGSPAPTRTPAPAPSSAASSSPSASPSSAPSSSSAGSASSAPKASPTPTLRP